MYNKPWLVYDAWFFTSLYCRRKQYRLINKLNWPLTLQINHVFASRLLSSVKLSLLNQYRISVYHFFKHSLNIYYFLNKHLLNSLRNVIVNNIKVTYIKIPHPSVLVLVRYFWLIFFLNTQIFYNDVVMKHFKVVNIFLDNISLNTAVLERRKNKNLIA